MTVTPQSGFVTAPFANGTEGAPASYFRRDFTAEEGLRSATLSVSAIGLVEAHLNGAVVGDEVLAPGWTSYSHRLAVSAHDVTHDVEVGPNTIGAVVGQGWALGRLGWEGKANHYSSQPAVLVELTLEYADRTELVTADGQFRVSTGGVRANSIYDGETFDARLEPTGWDSPGFDDSAWLPAIPFDWSTETLFERTAEPIRRVEELAPQAITLRGEAVIVDFGQNISGWVRLTTRGGAAGQEVVVRHAELLTPDGDLDVETLRTARATDTWVLSGPDETEFEPRFTFHGFRYAEITGLPGAALPEDFRAVVVHSDMTRTGWFSTSNELVNQLHENAVWSMRGNFVGVPTDCPQRDERLGWTGDLNAFAPTASYLFDVRGVLGSWLKDLAVEQAATGNVPWVVPDVMSTPSSPTALWSDVAVSLPWTLYREYGDPETLETSYESMTSFMRQVEALLDSRGLWSGGFQFGDWLDPDAPDDNPAGGKTDRHLVAAAYLCKTTREMAETATVLGREADSAHFTALASRVRGAFRSEYVTRSGRVVNESATAYALAICFDILDDDQLVHAGNQLAALVAKTGYTISTGFAGTPLLLDALTRTGHLDEAYLLLLQTECPSFLYPVTQGATTIWERWDSVRPDGTINPSGMTSLNHYALGAVASWLHRVVGGLASVEPGWRRIRIAPLPGGGLTHASASHDTVLGRASVSWWITDGTMHVETVVPTGSEAEVVLPLHPDALVVTAEPGAHQWTYDIDPAYGTRPQHTMDTPLAEIATDPKNWSAVVAVFAEHLPGIPIDPSGPGAEATSLNMILGFIPGASDELRLALENALHSPTV